MERPTKSKAKSRLTKVLDEIPELKTLQRCSQKFNKWRRNCEVAITNVFGQQSNHVTEFKAVHYSLSVFSSRTPESAHQSQYVKGLESAASLLESMLEEIEEYWEDEEQSQRVADSYAQVPQETNKVFVIHGHDESAREMVARFLERLELDPVILHEQPNEGQTIIEKFEEHADVGFAVVLLTPDDKGKAKDAGPDLRPRARQNVVFEFGYFIGKLGRKKVCALVKSDIERPSDSDGLLYIPLDSNDGWQFRLLRELNAAGLRVDANKALSS